MKFKKDVLIKIIKDKCIMKSKLQEELNITRTSFWKWERGKSVPSEKNIRKLAKLLNVSVSEISDLKELEIDNLDSNLVIRNINNNWLKETMASYTERTGNKNRLKNQIDAVYSDLSESRMIISALLNNMEHIFYIKNHRNKYITANNKFIELMKLNEGFNVSEKNDFDLMSKIDAIKNKDEDQLLIENNKKIIYEGYIPNTRKKRWAVIIKSPILNEENSVCGLTVTYTDITERKIVEERIKILDSAINQSNTVTWITRKDSIKDIKRMIVYYVSDSVSNLYGYPKEEYYNDPYFFYDHSVYPEDKDIYLKMKEKRTLNPDNLDSLNYQLRIYTKKKEIKWIEASASIIKFDDKEYYIFVNTDITDRKNYEQLYDKQRLNIASILYKDGVDIDSIIKATELTKDAIINKR